LLLRGGGYRRDYCHPLERQRARTAGDHCLDPPGGARRQLRASERCRATGRVASRACPSPDGRLCVDKRRPLCTFLHRSDGHAVGDGDAAERRQLAIRHSIDRTYAQGHTSTYVHGDPLGLAYPDSEPDSAAHGAAGGDHDAHADADGVIDAFAGTVADVRRRQR
jgi:hypothetical protein